MSKTNPNDSLYAAVKKTDTSGFLTGSPTFTNTNTGGLTKREHMAIEFMKAYLTKGPLGDKLCAKLSLEAADTLIAELNKDKKDE